MKIMANVENGSLKYHVPALEKGLDILEALAATATPQSLSDLARGLNRSSSELFRMLDCLERRGYIARDAASGNYRLTLKLYELAHTHSPVEQLLHFAELPMQQLAQTLRESCHLSILQYGKLIVLAQAESPARIRLSVEVGGQFSAIHTASGRLLLAYLTPAEREAFLVEDPDYQELTEGQQQECAARIAEIERLGYSTIKNETHIGVTDTAVLVGNPRAGVVAALTIASLSGAHTPDTETRILDELLACAQTITAAMGVSQ